MTDPRPRVLVVDDDDGVRQCLLTLLEESYDVRTAASGPEALRLVAESVPDVMLLDVRMPDMDGLEVLRRLRAAEARFPVILLTAVDSARTAAAAMKLGAHDYLTKPSIDTELHGVLHDALVSRQPPPPAASRDDELVVWHTGGNLGRRAVLGGYLGGIPGVRVAPPGTVVFDAEPDMLTIRATLAGADDRLRAAAGALSALTIGVMALLVRAYRSATVEDIAARMVVSPRHLLRRFDSDTGMSLKEYFGRVRTEAAKCLLLETTSAVDIVGEEVGFCDTSHFARVFRQYTDLTPGAYCRRVSEASCVSSDSSIV